MIDDFTRLKMHLEQVAASHSLTVFQVIEKSRRNVPVPVSIFSRRLSPLQSLVKFLHENKNFSFTEIASILNNDPRTVWQASCAAKKKYPQPLSLDSDHLIPLFVFSDKRYSILYLLVSYLHEQYNLTFAELARIIDRDPRTVWTTYSKFNKTGKNRADTAVKSLDDFTRLKMHLEQVAAAHGLTVFQVLEKISKDAPVPVSIFSRRLSPLQSLVKFLHEDKKLSFTEIASLLNKDPKAAWQAGRTAQKKFSQPLSLESDYLIPLFVFSDKRYSALYVLVSYLHEQYALTFAQIARIIDRDPRTVWTTYNKFSRSNRIKTGTRKKK